MKEEKAFASIKVEPYGVHGRSIFDFFGALTKKKLIEIFVELHYCLPGDQDRPNAETWAAIQKHSDEIDDQKKHFRERWGIDNNEQAGRDRAEGKK